MVVHGTTVAMAGQGMLIRGPSGIGKSALALTLMALGAGLVADDQTRLARLGGVVIADAPEALRGRIEARHIGILGAEAVGPVPLAWVVTLGSDLPPRLPETATAELLGVSISALAARPDPRLAPALRQLLLAGRAA